MNLTQYLKRLLAACLVFALLCVPMPKASAAGGYSTKDMFTSAPSIKGVQGALNSTAPYGRNGSDQWGVDMGEIHHSLVNININECIFSPDHPWAKGGQVTKYEFEGEDFYFGYPDGWNFSRDCNRNNLSISFVFLVQWTAKSEEYGNMAIDEWNRDAGMGKIYAPAVEGYNGKAVRAFWHFFMEGLIEDGYHVDNFILGNEVNMPGQWNYCGTSDPDRVVSLYTEAFYGMWSAVREYTNVSRCSVSLDHSWNWVDQSDLGFGGREFLNLFDAKLKEKNNGNSVDWYLSYHPYPAFLYNAEIWEEHYGFTATTDDEDTPFIDGSNLSVMTNYVREHFGEEHRIMLTEQGYTKEQGEEIQAAALAYAYYTAMYDPMVDSFLLHYSDDGMANTNEGTFSLDFTFYPLTAEVYRRIDSGKEEDARWIAEKCLPVIGVESWSEIVPNFGENVKPVKDGLYFEDGKACLYKDDAIDTSYTGWYTHEQANYLLKNGVEVSVPERKDLPGHYTGWYKDGASIRWLDNGETARNKRIYDAQTDKWYYQNADGIMTRGLGVATDDNGNETFYRYNKDTGVEEGIVDIKEIDQVWVNDCYWYENGVRQGYDSENPEYRGKEIYDPATDAWYWLDNNAYGKKAVSKDVYQESNGGKWVRYDANGLMIKGDQNKDGNWFHFDRETGAMAKGLCAADDGKIYYYNETNGIREWKNGIETINDENLLFVDGALAHNTWVVENGMEFWYEGGIKQGTEGRGKEIYDPASDAWYWLDSIDGGKKAVSKDLYQESNGGKWVRYDEYGHMIKGWNSNDRGTYYFDLTTGAMAKGEVEIDGEKHFFAEDTGIMQW